ncbi:three component ABC system middle component [Burkholderia ambifaria]|uniref:three component ABC system middle component n=1 Tax=Burkholderia ambifaria TaxID=152480 RepID=UPI001FC7EAEB|nr:three component ABC system middle component [Burkholderia ambifaria]
MQLRDDNLIHNSALGGLLLTTFVRAFEEASAHTERPDFLRLLLVLPILWHQASCDEVRRRQFDTPLHAVLSDRPQIKTDFQERISAFTPVTGRALNLVCAAKLLRMYAGEGGNPVFATSFSRWPQGSKPTKAPPEMLQAIDRLAIWYSSESTAQLYSRFLTN